MRDILSAGNRNILKGFASPDTLVAFDFDGTLAPIVRDRNRAALRPGTRTLLAGLAACYPCAVISGRRKSDIRNRLSGTGIKDIVGNHGIEPWSTSPALEKAVRRWLPLLEAALGQFRAVEIENKRFSVAVHYRGEVRKPAARRAIKTVTRKLGAVRLIGGKQVVNILPAMAPHKGLAFERLLHQSGCDKAIYVGDDDTDEDVFAIPCHGRTLTIRVGLNRDSLAGFYIRNQRDIDRLIRLLMDLRAGRRASQQALTR